MGNIRMNLQMWDTKSPHKHKKLPLYFYSKSSAIVFVYSWIDKKSYDKIAKWVSDLKEADRDDIEFVTGSFHLIIP